MKLALDYLPIVLFVAVYYLSDIYIATGVLIVALFLQVGLTWLITREVQKMLLLAAVLALIFGGATIIIHDPTFIKVKPSVLYWLFAAVLVTSQFIGEKNLIQRALEKQLELPNPVWTRLNLMWAGFFVLCGVANLYVAYEFSEEFWVNFKLFGMLGLTVVFVVLQGLYLAQYLPRDEDTATDTKDS